MMISAQALLVLATFWAYCRFQSVAAVETRTVTSASIAETTIETIGGDAIDKIVLSSTQGDTDVSALELYLLYDLYNATNGTGWDWKTNRTAYGIPWNFSAPYPCRDRWQGIVCGCALDIDMDDLFPAVDLASYNCSINVIYLEGYNLYGTVPSSVGSFPLLFTLSLKGNTLFSTIPESLGSMPLLGSLDLSNNALTGSLPSAFGNLSMLVKLSIHNNALTSTIPDSFGNLHFLLEIKLQHNLLSGTLPWCLGELRNMMGLDLGSNFLTGTIPSNYGNYSNWYGFSVDRNQLTGTVPSELMQLPNLFVLALSANCLTGTLPLLGSLKNIEEYYVYFNVFTGNIHNLFDNATEYLTIIGLDHNTLSGTLPATFGQMSNLEQVFVDSNHFTGDISVFDSSNQPSLQYIELSTNSLTGTIPGEIFSMPALLTFSATSNCLTGSIPSAICSAESLQTLAIDGMHTSHGCRVPVVRDTPYSSSAYYLSVYAPGQIPACLFNMSSLQTLHLSGNGLQGQLPHDLNISATLKELTLSHNILSGTIPHVIQARSWTKLDLSHNFFKDTLSPAFAMMTSNYTLSLQNNRLSGRIPRGMLHAKHINVLATGLFECYSGSQLPRNDPDYTLYQCGSNDFEVALLFFTCALCVGLSVVLWYIANIYSENKTKYDITQLSTPSIRATAMVMDHVEKKPSSDNSARSEHQTLGEADYARSSCAGRDGWCFSIASVLRTWLNQFNQRSPRENKLSSSDDNIFYFKRMTDSLIWKCILFTLVSAVLWATYESLAAKYSTYVYTYAFQGSAAFFGGDIAGYTMLVGFICMMAVTYVCCDWGLAQESLSMVRNEAILDETLLDDASHEESWSVAQWLKLIALLLINFLVVIIINGVYVGVQIYGNDTIGKKIILIQFSYVGAKLVWNNVAFRYLFSRLHFGQSGDQSNLSKTLRLFKIEIFTLIFNNIATPCLVVMCVSPQCFYDVLNPPPPVQSSFDYAYCTYYTAVNNSRVLCTEYDYDAVQTTSFKPPFTYTFQCSSSIVTYYSAAFVYMFLVVGLLIPLGRLTLRWLCVVLPAGSFLQIGALNLSSRLFRPLDVNMAFDQSIAAKKNIFDNYWYSLQYVVRIAMLLTFGVAFPPLAVIICMAITLSMYTSVFAMGHLLHEAEREGALQYRVQLESECKYIWNPLAQTKWIILCFMGLFYGGFVFDTLGDISGFNRSFWALIVMSFMPLLLYIFFEGSGKLYQMYDEGFVMSLEWPAIRIGADLGRGSDFKVWDTKYDERSRGLSMSFRGRRNSKHGMRGSLATFRASGSHNNPMHLDFDVDGAVVKGDLGIRMSDSNVYAGDQVTASRHAKV